MHGRANLSKTIGEKPSLVGERPGSETVQIEDVRHCRGALKLVYPSDRDRRCASEPEGYRFLPEVIGRFRSVKGSVSFAPSLIAEAEGARGGCGKTLNYRGSNG